MGLLKNKKANNMASWTEGIVFVLLFVIAVTIVIAAFNSKIGTTNTIGLDTASLDDFNSLAESSNAQINEGQTSLTSFGLTLLSSWALAKGIFGVLWSFFNGQWINYIILDMLQIANPLGSILAITLRVLFLLSLIFAIIKLFFKTSV
jgi:hypothetical protein